MTGHFVFIPFLLEKKMDDRDYAMLQQVVNVLEDIRQELSLIRERLPVSKVEIDKQLLNEENSERRKWPRND